MVRIVLSKVARKDLKDIVDYIKRTSVYYAYLEKQKNQEAIDKLGLQPLKGKELLIEGQNFREWVFRNYRIIYQIENTNLIHILTIHHHAWSLSNNPAVTDDE